MNRYPQHLLKLIELFKHFPGIGMKSAERLAFQLINWPEEKRALLAQAVHDITDQLAYCPDCGALISQACTYCQHPAKEPHLLCVVAHAKDLFSIESTGYYKGAYHVLGGLLCPIDPDSFSDERIEKLKLRIQSLNIKEVILALDSTIEGDATALYLKKVLSDESLSISRLAFGLPMGSSLDFIDGGTLSYALEGRHRF
jgi:recombination protein RecR